MTFAPVDIPDRRRGRPPAYSDAFRALALSLAADGSRTIAGIARELNLPRTTLDRWISDHRAGQRKAPPIDADGAESALSE